MKFFMGESHIGQVFCAPGPKDYTVDECGIMEVKDKKHVEHFTAAGFATYDPDNPAHQVGGNAPQVEEEEQEEETDEEPSEEGKDTDPEKKPEGKVDSTEAAKPEGSQEGQQAAKPAEEVSKAEGGDGKNPKWTRGK